MHLAGVARLRPPSLSRLSSQNLNPLPPMAGLQLSGLASGFDWKSFVDQIMSYERAPATTMQTEISNNQLKLTALSGVENRINDLRSAVKALNTDGLFDARSATSSTSGWSASASSTSPIGTHSFNVTQLATSARWNGAADIGRPLSTTSDVSALTLANLGTATVPTAGVFTVNGARVTVDLADSLQEVFDNISTATSGAVTAAYDPAQDKITLTGTSGNVVLGSATDTSNFLSAVRLSNNGTATTSSASRLGATSTTATLANSRLATAVTAVDGAGAGSFELNGVTLAYNLNTDTLSSVLARINSSAAGVTASYDSANDRVTLANTATGDLGVAMSESAGGLLAALGLTSASGATLTRGLDAEFTVNNGATFTSHSNTLTEDAHGITGLSLTPSTSGSSSVTIASDASRMRSRIDTFISTFNSLQTYIESQTKVTSTNGKVTSATLAGNREIQNWTSQLRSSVFNAVPGLESAIARLDHLGIDFTGTDATLAVKDSAKLDAALRDRPADVSNFFRQASTGMATRLENLFTSYTGLVGGAGLIGGQRTSITNSNTSLTAQIADLDRRLAQRRSQLEAGFIAMERAQSTLQQMQSQLTNAFPTSSK